MTTVGNDISYWVERITRRLSANRVRRYSIEALLLFSFLVLLFLIPVKFQFGGILQWHGVAMLLGLLYVAVKWFRNPIDPNQVSQLLDREWNSKERLVSYWEIQQTKGNRDVDLERKDSYRQLLEDQIRPLIRPIDVKTTLPFQLDKRLARGTLSLPFLWGMTLLLWFLWNPIMGKNQAEQQQLQEVLSKNEDLTPALKEKLEDLQKTLSTHDISDSSVQNALQSAREELEKEEQEMAKSTHQMEAGLEADIIPPASQTEARHSPTPTPSQKMREAERKKEEQQKNESSSDDQKKQDKQKDQKEGTQQGAKDESADEGSSSKSGPSQQKKEGSEKKDQKGSEQGEGDGDGKGKGKDNSSGTGKGQKKGEQEGGSGSGKEGQSEKEGQGKEGQGQESQSGASGKEGQEGNAGQSGNESVKEALSQIEKKSAQAQSGKGEGKQEESQKPGAESSKNQNGDPKDPQGKSGKGAEKKGAKDPSDKDQSKGGEGKSPSSETPKENEKKQGSSSGGQGKEEAQKEQDSSKKPGEGKNEEIEKSPQKDPSSQDSQSGKGGQALPTGDVKTQEGVPKDGEGLPKPLQNMKFQTQEIQGDKETVRPEGIGKDQEVVENRSDARLKTKLSDVILAKPETQSMKSEQHIPVEYQDLIK